MISKRVLCIDDNEQQSRLFEIYGSMYENIEVDCSVSLEGATELIKHNEYDLVLLDNRLHPHEHFSETLPAINQQGYLGKVVIMSADIAGALSKESAIDNSLIYIDKSDLGVSGFRKLMTEHVLSC